MKILIGADIVPTESNENYFINKDIEHLVGEELAEVLKNADYRIFNLEAPLVSNGTPIEKAGPCLSANPYAVNGIKELGADFVTLANNHILDMGEKGLWNTASVLDSAGISYAGVGCDLKGASEPHIIEMENKKIGIYCCAEHEFSIAREDKAGANPFDPLESLDHIENLKNLCDYVICLYHGGKEYYRYPSPKLQKVCRKIAEKGADLVVCQHTHCIGCEEKYKDSTIVYGQGNFLFDGSENEVWQTSLLLSLDLEGEISYIPLVKNRETVRIAKGEQATEILDGFKNRSEEIQKENFVENKWKEFSNSAGYGYLVMLAGIRRTFLHRVLNRISGGKYEKYLLSKKLSCKKTLALKNLLECEPLNELITSSLDNYRESK